MKKLIMNYLFLLTGLAFAFTACQRDEELMGGGGDMQQITVTIPRGEAPEGRAVTDDFGKGLSVNRCILEIYNNDALVQRLEKGVAGKTVTFDNLRLVADQEYDFVFWADCATENDNTFADKIYKTSDGLKVITGLAAFEGNSDERDAFFAHETMTVDAAFAMDVTLTRPFGLLTLRTDDWAAVQAYENDNLKPTSYRIAFTGMPDTFDASTGEVSTTGDGSKVEYYSEDFAKADGTISMDFLWASEEEATLSDFTVTFYRGEENLLAVNDGFRGIPLRRNYKTNISGNLITKQGEIAVKIAPVFDGEYQNEALVVETVADITAALEAGETNIVVAEAPMADANIVIPKIFDAETEISIRVPASGQKITISEGDGSESLPAMLHLDVSTTGTLVLDTPTLSVDLSGNYGSIEASTADNTLIIAEGATVGKLTVTKGNVEIYGTVGELTLAEGCKVTVYSVADGETLLKAAALTCKGQCDKIVLADNIEVSPENPPIVFNNELDLNEKTLTVNVQKANTRQLTVHDNLTVRNGKIEAQMDTPSALGIFVIPTNTTGTFDGITFNSPGTAFYPQGDAAKLVIKNSTVYSYAYAVSTNATTNQTLEIVLENSTFTAEGAAVMMNISGNLTVNNCNLTGNTHGLIVRGGTAKVSNSTLTVNYKDADYESWSTKFDNEDWGTGNTLPSAALTIGNKHPSSYQYPTNVTLVNTQLKVEGPHAGYFPPLYAYANQGEGLGVTFNYDEQCQFDEEKAVYASENIVVNGVKNPWNGTSTTSVTPNAEGVYEIFTAAQLAWLAQEVNSGNTFEGKTVRLTGDINLAGHEWTPIGNGFRDGADPSGNQFAGTFDGVDYTIDGLKITTTRGADYALGLFGVVNGGTVKDLTFENVAIDVDGSEMAAAAVGMLTGGGTVSGVEVISGSLSAGRGNGAVVGRLTKNGTISDCTNRIAITGKASGGNTGGIVGAAYYTDEGETMTITDCHNYGEVTGIYGVGGIVGLCAANVEGCTNEGNVVGRAACVGGIVAEQQNAGSVKNCVNRGKVTNGNSGVYGTGGIVGWVRYNGAEEKYPAKNIIEVSGNKNYAAIVGGNDAGGIVGTVYNYGEIVGNENYAPSLESVTFVAGIVGNAQFTETPVGLDEPNMVNVKNNTSTTSLDDMTGSCKDVFVYINEQDAVTEENNTDTSAGE